MATTSPTQRHVLEAMRGGAILRHRGWPYSHTWLAFPHPSSVSETIRGTTVDVLLKRGWITEQRTDALDYVYRLSDAGQAALEPR